MVDPVTADSLFDADFLESLQRLRLVAQRVPKGGRFAEQRSRALGAGLEFHDYRPYATGDDLRAIDWNIYRRLGKVFLRLFEELEDLPVYLLPDISGSLWAGDGQRVRAGLQSAMALAAIALGQHDRVGLLPFADDMQVSVRPRSGWHQLPHFAKALAELEPGGGTDFHTSLRRFSAMGLRQGLVVVISDFFDPQGLDSVLPALKRLEHRLLLVQLVDPADRSPKLDGDLRLTDCESGQARDLTVTPELLRHYTEAYDHFLHQLTSFATKRRIGLVGMDVTRPVVEQLATVFEGGRYSA